MHLELPIPTFSFPIPPQLRFPKIFIWPHRTSNSKRETQTQAKGKRTRLSQSNVAVVYCTIMLFPVLKSRYDFDCFGALNDRASSGYFTLLRRGSHCFDSRDFDHRTLFLCSSVPYPTPAPKAFEGKFSIGPLGDIHTLQVK